MIKKSVGGDTGQARNKYKRKINLEPYILCIQTLKEAKVFLVTDYYLLCSHSCGGPAKRVTDTMDTFFDSSWYYLRYLDVSNEKVPFDPKVVQSLLPVDVYVCSKEHGWYFHLL